MKAVSISPRHGLTSMTNILLVYVSVFLSCVLAESTLAARPNAALKDLRLEAVECLASGNVVKASRLFARLVEKEKSLTKSGRSEALADAYHALGDCYAQLNNDLSAQIAYRDTIRAATESVRSKSLVSDSFVGLGKIAQKQGRFKQAGELFKQSLTFNGLGRHEDSAATWRLYAAVMQRLGKTNESKMAIENAQSLQQCKQIFACHRR